MSHSVRKHTCPRLLTGGAFPSLRLRVSVPSCRLQQVTDCGGRPTILQLLAFQCRIGTKNKPSSSQEDVGVKHSCKQEGSECHQTLTVPAHYPWDSRKPAFMEPCHRQVGQYPSPQGVPTSAGPHRPVWLPEPGPPRPQEFKGQAWVSVGLWFRMSLQRGKCTDKWGPCWRLFLPQQLGPQVWPQEGAASRLLPTKLVSQGL